MASRGGRSAMTRILMSSWIFRLAAISFNTASVRPALPIITVGFRAWARPFRARRSEIVRDNIMAKVYNSVKEDILIYNTCNLTLYLPLANLILMPFVKVGQPSDHLHQMQGERDKSPQFFRSEEHTSEL